MPFALCSVVNDEFVAGFIVMLATLRRENPRWNFPVAVIAERGEDFLGPAGRALIARYCPQAVIVDVDPVAYAPVHAFARTVLRTPERLMAAFYILEAFRLPLARRVVALDSDVLVTGSLDELLLAHGSFAAVRAWAPGARLPAPYVNTGLMILDRATLPQFADLDRMVDMLAGVQPRPGAGKADQAIINMLFDNDAVTHLPARFNYTKRMLVADLAAGYLGHGDELATEAIAAQAGVWTPEHIAAALRDWDVRILHYVNEKPWQIKIHSGETLYSAVDTLWWQSFDAVAGDDLRAHLAGQQRLWLARYHRALGSGRRDGGSESAMPPTLRLDGIATQL